MSTPALPPLQLVAYRERLFRHWLFGSGDADLDAATVLLGAVELTPGRGGCVTLAEQGWWARVGDEFVSDSESGLLYWRLHVVERVIDDLVRVWPLAALAYDLGTESVRRTLYDVTSSEVSRELKTWSELVHELVS